MKLAFLRIIAPYVPLVKHRGRFFCRYFCFAFRCRGRVIWNALSFLGISRASGAFAGAKEILVFEPAGILTSSVTNAKKTPQRVSSCVWWNRGGYSGGRTAVVILAEGLRPLRGYRRPPRCGGCSYSNPQGFSPPRRQKNKTPEKGVLFLVEPRGILRFAP